MTQRELFEEFARQYLDDLRKDGDGNYVDRTTYQWFMVWQAAQQRSEEGRAVEEMMRELGKGDGAAGKASICRALYRAGYRKEDV